MPHGLIDTVFVLRRAQGVAPLRRLALSHGDARRRNEAGEICAHRLAVFRLAPHRRKHIRIGRKPGERSIEGRARNAALFRFGPQALHIWAEGPARLTAGGKATAATGGKADEQKRVKDRRARPCTHSAAARGWRSRISCR